MAQEKKTFTISRYNESNFDRACEEAVKCAESQLLSKNNDCYCIKLRVQFIKYEFIGSPYEIRHDYTFECWTE